MKKLFFLISILPYLQVNGQLLNDHESFSVNRVRVWETLSNLPLEKSDWRYDDLRKNFLENWQREIFRTIITYTSGIEDYDTPSMYYLSIAEGEPSRIELDSLKFTLADDINHCVEHELGHAAFKGNMNVPGWLLYLGNQTAKLPGQDALPYERIVRALVLRRDIIDYFGLTLNAVITQQQLQYYIDYKAEIMDFGLNWLLETTRAERLLPLINFENGYLINEKANYALLEIRTITKTGYK
jgi:hypothetical protein